MNRRHIHNQQGVALILTLTILAVVLLLLMAFITSMRTERMIAKNYNDLTKARFIADAAVDQAVAVIKNATPIITPPDNTYVTGPGTIFTRTNGSWRQTKLFTVGADTFDLNTNNVITGVGAAYPPNTPITVAWTNIVVDGELVGRFAYWVDDESTKVDLNLAGTRGNDMLGMTPAAIDLQDLENFTAADQIAVTQFVAGTRPFDTEESIKQVSASVTNKYSNNKFYMTVNSVSPDLTPWGTKRINIVAVATNASLTADQKVTIIASALNDPRLTTWFGQTFGGVGGKYPSAEQIAANIIDYIDTDNVPTDSGTTPPTYLGLEQTPYINELVVSNSIVITTTGPTTKTLAFTTTTMVELWNMYTNGWTAASAAGGQVVLENRPSITFSPAANVLGSPSVITFPSPVTIPATTAIPPSNYWVASVVDVTATITITNLPTTVILNPGTVTAVYQTSIGRIDYAQIPLTNYVLPVTSSTLDGVTNYNWVTACNDPRVKPVNNNWNTVDAPAVGVSPKGTPGGFNSGTLLRNKITTNTPPIGIRMDGDDSCHVRAGNDRDRGTMSLGELAYIHVGMPWRTFWLQPQFRSVGGEVTPTRAIPDWAVLDLFSTTDSTNVTGRININAKIWDANSTPPPPRLVPLKALLTNSIVGTGPMTTRYSEATAMTNVYNQVLVNSRLPAFCQSAYTMIGEACEVEGMANIQPLTAPYIPDLPGSWSNWTKSQRETATRGIAGLITTRSNTFTIWAIAQSIKKVDQSSLTTFDPTKDLITGEVKVQAIVERYEDAGQVKFRTKYYRYIYD